MKLIKEEGNDQNTLTGEMHVWTETHTEAALHCKIRKGVARSLTHCGQNPEL